MQNLPKEAFYALYELAQRKVKYEQFIKENGRRKGLAALFSNQPRDPFPEGMDRIRELVPYAFRSAFPESYAYQVGDRGPADSTAAFDVSMNYGGELKGNYHCSSASSRCTHDEFYEFKSGYGLQFQYSHDPDPSKDAVNRNLAYSSFMGSRMEGPFFDRQNRTVDSIRSELKEAESSKVRSLSLKQLMGYFRMVDESKKESVAESRGLQSVVAEKCVKVTDLESYVLNRQNNNDITFRIKSGEAVNDTNLRALYGENENKMYAYRNRHLAEDLLEKSKPVVSQDALMDYTKRVFAHNWMVNPDVPENKRNHLFLYAKIAREHGMPSDKITSNIEQEAYKYGIQLSQNDYRVISDRIEEVDASVRKNFDEFIAVNHNMDRKPDAFVEAFLEDNFRKNVMDYVKHGDIDKALLYVGDISEDSRVTAENLSEAVARDMYDHHMKVSVERVADAVAIQTGKGLSNSDYYASRINGELNLLYGEDFKKVSARENLLDVLDGCSSLTPEAKERGRRFDSDPSSILAGEMAAAAYGMAGGDSRKLGAYLRDIGLDPHHDFNSDLAPQFRTCAKKMYQDGSIEAAKNVSRFRERYKEEIKAGQVMVRGLRQTRLIQAGLDPQEKTMRHSKGLSS